MNVNNNISNFDWSTTINTILGSDGAEGANGLSGTGVVEGDSLIITVTNAEGKTVNFTVESPELDPATGTPDETTLRKIAERLDGIAEEFERQYKELASQVEAMDLGPHSTGTQKVLFDIYQLMSMVIQLAQHQREVSRTMRYADLQISTSSIQNQADAQRRAAQTGLIMSCCLSGISILASLGMAIKSNAAAGKATAKEMQIGADQTQKAYALSQASTKGEAQTNLSKVESKMTPDEIKSAQENFKTSNDAKLALDDSQSQLEGFLETKPELKEAIDAADKKISAKESEITDATKEVDVAEKKVSTAQSKVDSARKAFQEAKDKKASPATCEKLQKALDAAENELKTAQGEKTAAESKVANLKKDLETLKGDRQYVIDTASQDDRVLAELNSAVEQNKAAYEQALKTDVDRLNGKLDIAISELEQLKNDPTASKEAISQKESEVAALKKQATWGRAHVTSEFHEYSMNGALREGMQDCRQNFEAKKAMLEADGEYRKAMAQANFWGGISQTVNQLNSLCQSLTQYAVTSQEAESTEMQKEQKEADAAREESNDLFGSSKEMLDAALKLMNAIQQTEQDTFRQIMA